MLTNVNLEKAQEILLGHVDSLPYEFVSLLKALDRVVHRDLFAVHDLPPYPQAAMDGYAVPAGASGRNKSYTVTEHLQPGEMPGSPLGPGLATAVVTGGPLPAGTGAVIPHEAARHGEDSVTFKVEVTPGSNIKPLGEDFLSGALLARRGDRITPGLMSALAAFGKNEVEVFCRPRVAVLSLGQEIVPCHVKPSAGQRRDSNGPLLAALVSRDGGMVKDVEAVGVENTAQVEVRLQKLLQRADLVLTTGGAASGASDQALQVLRQMGAQPLFWGVKIKPGSHSGAVVSNGKLIVSLSGNPAACAVGYYLLVAPVLRAMQGLSPYPQRLSALCANTFLKKGGPRRFVQGYATCSDEGWMVTVLPGQKSSMMRALIGSNALIELPAGHLPLYEGSKVSVILLNSLYNGRNGYEKSQPLND